MTYNYERRDGTGTVIDEYVYDDKDREPYHRVQRTDTHQFPQAYWVRGIDGFKKGHWNWGAPKVKIPYMLPWLIEAPLDQWVFITEGEKDADTIANWELIGTTNPGGAGKWQPELNQWFVGRKVAVLEDNDRVGRNHARKVAHALVNVASQVRIVNFRDMPEKSDVTDWKDAGGTKEQLLEKVEAAPRYVAFQIKIVAGEIARAVNETQDAIMAAMEADLPVAVLRRADFLVQPLYTSKPSSHGRKTQVTVLKRISVSNLRYIVSKWVAVYTKRKKDKDKNKDVVIDPPTNVLQDLLDLGHWPFFHVSGVINSPTMRPDGTILIDAGYDQATGLWHYIDLNLTVPAIEERPDKAKAIAALQLLEDLLDEFPFVTELDRAVALAAILTAVLRGAFIVCPMFLFAAHTPGTGKSYLVDLISSIVQGRWCPVIGWHASEEEVEKRIGALMLEGVPIISIDNCSRDLEGDALSRMCERPVNKIRILGKSETPECEWRGTLLATGNNIGFTGDMIRRGLPCNLDAKMERPETRSFSGDPVAEIMKDRGKYIAAALTIARAYAVGGERIQCDHPIASYGEWSKFVREPLIWLGKEDPVKTQEQSREEDPNRSAALQLIGQWRKHLYVGTPYKTGEIIARATAFANQERVLPDLWAVLLERAGTPRGQEIDARRLGLWLRSLRGQVYVIRDENNQSLQRYRIVVSSEDRAHGNRWKLERVEGMAGEEGVSPDPIAPNIDAF